MIAVRCMPNHNISVVFQLESTNDVQSFIYALLFSSHGFCLMAHPFYLHKLPFKIIKIPDDAARWGVKSSYVNSRSKKKIGWTSLMSQPLIAHIIIYSSSAVTHVIHVWRVQQKRKIKRKPKNTAPQLWPQWRRFILHPLFWRFLINYCFDTNFRFLQISHTSRYTFHLFKSVFSLWVILYLAVAMVETNLHGGGRSLAYIPKFTNAYINEIEKKLAEEPSILVCKSLVNLRRIILHLSWRCMSYSSLLLIGYDWGTLFITDGEKILIHHDSIKGL